MLVNPANATPTFTFYYLSTHTGSAASPNGIAYTTPADLDADHIVDYIYAGDIRGHLWRFDVTSQNPSNWGVSAGSAMFTTPGGQPITTKVTVASTPNSSGANRIVVSFGTGQKTAQTTTSASTYAGGTQGLYGIWDWNMAGWNALSTTQYASLTSNPARSYTYGAGTVPVINTSSLTQQIITNLGSESNGAGSTVQVTSISDNAVCWYSSTSCASGNNFFGWYMNLPGVNEQIIYSPVLQLGSFIVNSTIPAVITPYSCTSSNSSGFTYSINPTTGGGASSTFFGTATGQFNNYTNPTTGQTSVVSGIQLNGTGSVSIITLGGPLSPVTGTFLVTQTSSGAGAVVPVNPLGNALTTRLTWKELR
jgi:type IV pilus assembly protein PilY1